MARTHVLGGGSCWIHHDPTEDGDHGEGEQPGYEKELAGQRPVRRPAWLAWRRVPREVLGCSGTDG